MHEFWKGFAVLGLIISALTGAAAWMIDPPTTLIWTLRAGCPTIAIFCLGLFLTIHYHKDLVPDFLIRYCNKYFDRNGFCFTIIPTVNDGVCVLQVLYQCRHDSPCTAQIALRPEPGIFRRTHLSTLIIDISCDPAAFGIAAVPIAVPAEYQGKKLTYAIGASVEYPIGKGSTLRFRDGVVVRHNVRFHTFLGRTALVIGLMGGQVLWFSPTSVDITFPCSIAEVVPASMKPVAYQLWKLDDNPELDLDTLISFGGSTM